MPHKTGLLEFLLLFFIAFPSASANAQGTWKVPPSAPPEEYGSILINRISERNGVEPVTFSHWVHRRKHTCRVCHSELEFNMKLNTTEITEAANKSGKYCGAAGCHDGKTVFGHDKGNCEKCHNGNLRYSSGRFGELSSLPKTKFGNRVDWQKALNEGIISPLKYLSVKPSGEMGFSEELLLQAEWSGISPAVFPHRSHVKWLDCDNCHPDIFNIKKKTTKHFAMTRILAGEFCGVCHLDVAFPMSDCKRCHPGMRTFN